MHGGRTIGQGRMLFPASQTKTDQDNGNNSFKSCRKLLSTDGNVWGARTDDYYADTNGWCQLSFGSGELNDATSPFDDIGYLASSPGVDSRGLKKEKSSRSRDLDKKLSSSSRSLRDFLGTANTEAKGPLHLQIASQKKAPKQTPQMERPTTSRKSSMKNEEESSLDAATSQKRADEASLGLSTLAVQGEKSKRTPRNFFENSLGLSALANSRSKSGSSKIPSHHSSRDTTRKSSSRSSDLSRASSFGISSLVSSKASDEKSSRSRSFHVFGGGKSESNKHAKAQELVITSLKHDNAALQAQNEQLKCQLATLSAEVDKHATTLEWHSMDELIQVSTELCRARAKGDRAALSIHRLNKQLMAKQRMLETAQLNIQQLESTRREQEKRVAMLEVKCLTHGIDLSEHSEDLADDETMITNREKYEETLSGGDSIASFADDIIDDDHIQILVENLPEALSGRTNVETYGQNKDVASNGQHHPDKKPTNSAGQQLEPTPEKSDNHPPPETEVKPMQSEHGTKFPQKTPEMKLNNYSGGPEPISGSGVNTDIQPKTASNSQQQQQEEEEAKEEEEEQAELVPELKKGSYSNSASRRRTKPSSWLHLDLDSSGMYLMKGTDAKSGMDLKDYFGSSTDDDDDVHDTPGTLELSGTWASNVTVERALGKDAKESPIPPAPLDTSKSAPYATSSRKRLARSTSRKFSSSRRGKSPGSRRGKEGRDTGRSNSMGARRRLKQSTSLNGIKQRWDESLSSSTSRRTSDRKRANELWDSNHSKDLKTTTLHRGSGHSLGRRRRRMKESSFADNRTIHDSLDKALGVVEERSPAKNSGHDTPPPPPARTVSPPMSPMKRKASRVRLGEPDPTSGTATETLSGVSTEREQLLNTMIPPTSFSSTRSSKYPSKTTTDITTTTTSTKPSSARKLKDSIHSSSSSSTMVPLLTVKRLPAGKDKQRKPNRTVPPSA